MGCYLFQNTSVYVRANGAVRCIPWDEFVVSPMVDDHEAHVLIAEADGPALMDHVRRIRKAFPRGGISTCVLYATALRAFLQDKGLVPAGEPCLVADDLGDKFLLTASSGRQAAVTRAILARSPEKIVEEIRRTQKNEPVLRILSNNAQVIEALDAERRKEARFFGISFPAFEVLGRVKFPVALMSPEELVVHRKRALRRRSIAAWGMAVLMAGAGAACFSVAQAGEREVSRRREAMMLDKARLQHEQQELSARTYQARLKALPRAGLFGMFAVFTGCLPADSRMEHASWERASDMHWHFTSVVSFPRQEVPPFACGDVIPGAKVEHVFVQTRPGVRVSLRLTGEQREGVLP